MLSFALMLVQTTLAGSIKDLDKRNGFRDLKLGAACSEIESFSTEGVPNRKLVSYVRPADILQVGEAQLQNIQYGCYKDQLSQVRIVVLGKRNQQSLVEALVEAFGEPPVFNEESGIRTWSGKKVLLESFAAPVSDTMVVVITSQSLLQQRLRDIVDAKAAAVEDL
jgi:hypothetical protein